MIMQGGLQGLDKDNFLHLGRTIVNSVGWSGGSSYGQRGGTSEPSRLRVFISYSRKDEDFAQELLTGLELVSFDPNLDKHDIAAGEDWEARLGRLIESADTVIFVISPDAVASDPRSNALSH